MTKKSNYKTIPFTVYVAKEYNGEFTIDAFITDPNDAYRLLLARRTAKTPDDIGDKVEEVQSILRNALEEI